MMTNNKCPNGCKLPKTVSGLYEDEGKWYFGKMKFRYCPCCGAMMPNTLAVVRKFFSEFRLDSRLEKAERLLYKSEFNAAAREAFVVVEEVLRKKTGLDSHGVKLVNEALSYETDKKSGTITKLPLIKINNLLTESEKNEQDGLRFMLMGFFQGARNIFQHNQVGAPASNILAVIIQASYCLTLLDGNSLTKNAKWIKTSIDYNDVFKNMPSRIQRLKLQWALRRRKKK